MFERALDIANVFSSGCRNESFYHVGSFSLSAPSTLQFNFSLTIRVKMSNALAQYEKLVTVLATSEGVTVGQMFGKACIKIHGKAFVSQHQETVVFKLPTTDREKALALSGAVLWDPSGKGRPLKEWVALPAVHSQHFKSFAQAALAYVATLT